MDGKQENADIETIIEKAVKDNAAALSEEEQKEQAKLLKKVFIDNRPISEVYKIDQTYLDQVYRYAYTLYQQRKFDEALVLFVFLKTLVPDNLDYLGAVVHALLQQKKWREATHYLFQFLYFRPDDPLIFAKLSECFLELNELTSTLISLQNAITHAENYPELAKEKEKWKMQYEYILAQHDLNNEKIEAKKQSFLKNEA